MAHDGQDASMHEPVILPDLLDLTSAALGPLSEIAEAATARVRKLVTDGDRVSAPLIEANQTAAHGLAWLATYAESLRQMQKWADSLRAEGNFGELEQLIHQIAFGEFLSQVCGGIPMSQGEIVRLQDLGLGQEEQRALMSPHPIRQHAGGTVAAGGTDARAGRERDGRCDWARRGTGNDPRTVPPLCRGKGRTPCP